MKKHLLFGLFLLICYFPLFLHLDTLSLRLWDESRQAVNALEMALNGNLIVTYFEGQPELWNTKPPFLIWVQAFFMKVLGYNELAVRLPSALAGLGTILLFFYYCHKVLKNKLLGYVFGLLLITVGAYINTHGTRTGDYDAMLTLWENMYFLAFLSYSFVTDKNKKSILLWLTALGIILAFLTKGIAGFFFLPALAIYAFVTGEFRNLFQSKHFYLTAFTVASVVIGYYAIRDYISPGYFSAVQAAELGGRFLETQGGHQQDWLFYISDLYHNNRLGNWLFFLPLGLVLGLLEKGKIRNMTWLIILNCLIVFLILSSSATRVRWYLVPLYPLLIFIAAIGISSLLQGLIQLLQHKEISKTGIYITSTLTVFALIYLPYSDIIHRIYLPKDDKWEWQKTQYRDFMEQTSQHPAYTILSPKYNGHVIFYKKVYNDTKEGYHIKSATMYEFLTEKKGVFGEKDLAFSPNEKVMICEKQARKAFTKHYEYHVLEKWKECVLVEVKNEK